MAGRGRRHHPARGISRLCDVTRGQLPEPFMLAHTILKRRHRTDSRMDPSALCNIGAPLSCGRCVVCTAATHHHHRPPCLSICSRKISVFIVAVRSGGSSGDGYVTKPGWKNNPPPLPAAAAAISRKEKRWQQLESFHVRMVRPGQRGGGVKRSTLNAQC